MDINKLLAAWNQLFRNRHDNPRLPSQDVAAKTPEVDKAHEADNGSGSDNALELNDSLESHEAPESHDIPEASGVPETHEALDNSDSANSARLNTRNTNTDNSVVGGLPNFGRLTSDWVTTKVKAAASKIKTAALHVKDSVISAVKILKEKGVIYAAKALKDWVQEHPWEIALIVVPLSATAITAAILLATGFGPGGIVAGSAAAAMQAGIGNVVAHSVFAICTSAMMGGYGAPIIFGGTWALTVVAIAAAKGFRTLWNSPNERHLVRMQTEPSRTIVKSVDKAAEAVIFHSAVVAAFVVYYVKSRMQDRRQRPDDQRPLL